MNSVLKNGQLLYSFLRSTYYFRLFSQIPILVRSVGRRSIRVMNIVTHSLLTSVLRFSSDQQNAQSFASQRHNNVNFRLQFTKQSGGKQTLFEATLLQHESSLKSDFSRVVNRKNLKVTFIHCKPKQGLTCLELLIFKQNHDIHRQITPFLYQT